jgi:hypothetical protein
MNEELQELLRVPREDMHVELKRWMDPSDKVVQAKFAKELLALRNHGGGYLVILCGVVSFRLPNWHDPIRVQQHRAGYGQAGIAHL